MTAQPRPPRFIRVSGTDGLAGASSEAAITVRDMVLDHDDRIDGLETWRDELRGAWKFVTIALGASVLSAAASILSIVFLASQLAERAKP